MNFVGILYHLCHNEDDNFILFYIEDCDKPNEYPNEAEFICN